ncbi:MAG: ATP-binding protein [Polyangiales bacterium]
MLRDGDAQEVFIAGLAEFLGKYLESSARSALFIDDVHWLDASSRMVISRLAARLCPQGHMLVCGARNDEELHETIDRLESVLPVGLLEKLELGSLTEPDAHEVVAEFLGEAKVPSELVEPLSRLSDGTPLTLLELLDLAFEQRLLRPRHGTWQLDVAPLHQMRLPGSSRALIERRLALLDVNAVASLRAAAVVRSRISPTVLAAVTGTSDEEVRATLDRAAAARVLLRSSEGLYSFVHDCIWEALLRVVPAHEQRALHQRVADALWSERGTSSSHDYDIAKHLAAGIVEHNPLRTYEALRLAGKRAIAACDDALALSFLKPAQRAAQLAQLDLTRDFYVDLAETSLRAGATTESLGYFKLALTHSRPGTESAHVRGRIAWIHHNESRAQACWTELAAALREYNRRLPGETGLSLLRAGFSRAAARSPLGIVRAEQNDLETLCDLYVCCTRFAIESGNPTRALASILYLAAAATQLRPCRAVVYAEVYTAFGLSALSPRTPWREHLARGQRIAQEIADPIALTLYHQGYHVVLAWVGDIEEAERQAWICVVERGNYMELGELCHLCFGMYAMQNALGRPAVGLAWLERAIARVVQSARAPALFELIEEAACATLVALGRERELPELRRRVAGVQRTELQPGSYFHFLSYQHRVQTLIDNDELDAPFEALVREWQALGQKPKSTHIAVAIFFVHVAHARVHQCLRTPAAKRGPLLEKLRLALDDVEAVSGYTLIAGHACVTRAAYDWFRGATSDAEQLLAKAERLARETSNAWVSFAAARLRAHMLKARGKLTAARDEARTAAQLARVYGARSRLRVICEEFDLGEFMVDDRPGDPGDSPTVRRHLDALLHIAQASSRDLGPRRQARYIVEELLETLAAERGFLYMRDANTGMLHCHAACHASGEELVTDESACDGALVEQVYATGQTLLANTGRPRASAGSLHEHTCIVVALVLREQVVGVLYLDRHAAAGSFSSEDVALLEALANQVPVVLELAGALRERERLELNLRQAQKMEAIGRLAGGIAHDFNNILATIEFAAGCLTSRINPQGEEDLSEIRDASRRGAELTRQLLMLSRGKSVPPRRIDLVEVLQRQAPMLGRMVRSDVQIEMDLTDQALPAMADPSQIERLVMNLCRNASDAMPSGGGITIRLRLATQAPETLAGSSQQHSPGYAELSVIDTGTGMSDEVRSRLFEPFFTTKSTQQGTGLGLAIVYTIVQQYGGLIDVLSEVGAGTTFRIHLPLAHDTLRPAFAPISTRPQRDSTPPERRTGRKTIIVVDDDDILRKQSARTLEAAGFLVWVARDGQDALRVIAEADHEPELAVTDVQMPGMDGVQLAERLRTNHPDIKLVFVSGDGPDALISSGSLDDNAVFLQKPFKPDALLREVEMLLQSTSHTTAVSGIHKLLGAPPEIDEADLTR